MKISQRGIDVIKKFEGFRDKAYQDIVGIWTIGFGFTKGVKQGDTTTLAESITRLRSELKDYEDVINEVCTVVPNQNEFDAMCSLAWNIGVGGIRKSSVIKAHNRGDKDAAAAAFLLWNKAGGKQVRALTTRRRAEANLYLEPVGYSVATMPQSVDEPKPLGQSSMNRASVIGGGTAAIATVTEVAQSVSNMKTSIDGLGTWWPVPALLIVTIVACGFLIYKRWQLREEGRL